MRGKAIFIVMKKLLFLGACLMALASSPVMAQTGGPDVVVMTVKALGVNKVRVVLAYNGGKTEEQIVKNIVGNDQAQDEATSEYQRIIAKLYQQGYSIKSTFSQGYGDRDTSALIFVKGQ
jgi:hypothetical protein